jgi:hypothetical protein
MILAHQSFRASRGHRQTQEPSPSTKRLSGDLIPHPSTTSGRSGLLTQMCHCLIRATTLGTTREARRTLSRSVDKESAATLSARSRRPRAQGFFMMRTHDKGTLRGKVGQFNHGAQHGRGMKDARAESASSADDFRRGVGPNAQARTDREYWAHVCVCSLDTTLWRAPARSETRHPSCDHLLGALARTRRQRSGTEPRTRRKRPQELQRQTFERQLGKKQSPCQQNSVGAPVRIEISACARRHSWLPPPDECQRSPPGSAYMRAKLCCVRSPRAAAPQHTEAQVLKPIPLLLCTEMFHLHSVYPATLLKLICGRRPEGGHEAQSLRGCLGIASSSGVLK